MESLISQQISLTDKLAKYAYAYYTEDNPMVDDAVYDKLYDDLVIMENQTGIILGNSPTHKVQGEVLASLKKVKHPTPMLSCAKTKDLEEIKKFYENSDAYECYTSIKADGISLRIVYENGQLVQAVTRGSAIEGEDVTHNARMIKNLPHLISCKERVELRGECVILYSDFEKMNEDNTFANPRNCAAGSIRQLDSNVTRRRQLRFYVFDLIEGPRYFDNKEAQMEWVETLGFETVIGKHCRNYEEVKDFIADIGKNRPDIPIDGCVVEYNGVEYAKSLGQTAHHENRHLAFKYTDDTVETIFRGVELNTGRNGVVSITGIFDPVEIDGTTVSRASLHNVDIFKGLELGVGDTITVYKANQIIPQIQDNLTRSNTYDLPLICPVCGNKLLIKKDVNTHILFCDNPVCTSQLLQKLVLFCSKDGMNIDGLGEAQLRIFIEKGWIHNYEDVYTLYEHGAEMESLEGFGELSVMNLLDAIDRSMNTDLAHIITALGIPGIGKTTAKLMAQYFHWNFTEFLNYLRNSISFCDIEGIGENTNLGIHEWYQHYVNQHWLGEIAYHIEVRKDFHLAVPATPSKTSSLFTNKSFCITGTFALGSRPQIIAQVEALGGKNVSSVSSKTDILLAGKDCGSKLQKANNGHTMVIYEDELKELLGVK